MPDEQPSWAKAAAEASKARHIRKEAERLVNPPSNQSQGGLQDKDAIFNSSKAKPPFAPQWESDPYFYDTPEGKLFIEESKNNTPQNESIESEKQHPPAIISSLESQGIVEQRQEAHVGLGYRYRSGTHRSRSARERALQHIEEADEMRRRYGDSFDHIKKLFLNLDKHRMNTLMNAYGDLYGNSARSYASSTVRKWRDGDVKMSGQTMARLFDLLPRVMSSNEKLELMHLLRSQAMKRLRGSTVNISLNHPCNLTAVVEQVIGQVKRVGEIEIPDDFSEVQGWLYESDVQVLDTIVKETAQHIATARLTDLMVQIASLYPLHTIAEEGSRVTASTHFSIPTASIVIHFTKNYWKGHHKMDSPNTSSDDADLIVRLQEFALREDLQVGNISYVDYVMRSLTPAEQARLRSIAATEGLRTEVLLKELQVKTLAARGDIKSVMDTAAELKAKGHNSKISSEHNTASGVTRIEIDNRKSGCVSGMVIGVFALVALVITAISFHG